MFSFASLVLPRNRHLYVWNCGDFNRSGILDHSWYDGDNTSQGRYLILSSPSGFRIYDLEKTFEKEWVRQRHTRAPDLGSSDENLLHQVRLRWDRDKMILTATGQGMSDPFGKITKIEAESQYWVALP